MNDLKIKKPCCRKCGSYEVSRIWNAEERITKGFYCETCRYFDKAIGREKKLPIEIKNYINQ